jgi:hypothetical protein
MYKFIYSLAFTVAIAAGAVAFTPSLAEAQCTWGCRCEGTACGCNSNGSGKSCDNGGSGCVVEKCGAPVELVFAPDGSVVRLAVNTQQEQTGSDAAAAVTTDIGGETRWEYKSDGVSVARNCSGVIVARRYEADVAAAARLRHRTVTL